VFHHSTYDDEGNATDRGMLTHSSIPTPKVLEWNIGEYDFEIEMFKDEFDTLVSIVVIFVLFSEFVCVFDNSFDYEKCG